MNKMKDSVDADGKLTMQYDKRENALKKYLGPCSLNIGLILTPNRKKDLDLAAAHHMNNNKLSRDKKKKDFKPFIVM